MLHDICGLHKHPRMQQSGQRFPAWTYLPLTDLWALGCCSESSQKSPEVDVKIPVTFVGISIPTVSFEGECILDTKDFTFMPFDPSVVEEQGGQ